jgi:hypothetical protein
MRPSAYEAHKGPVIIQLRVLGFCLGHSSRSWCASYDKSAVCRRIECYVEEQASRETRRSRLLEKHGGATPRRYTYYTIGERWQGQESTKLYIDKYSGGSSDDSGVFRSVTKFPIL